MACEHCSSEESRCAIILMLGPNIPARYCPACGESLAISEFLDSMKKAADDALTKAFVELDKANETVEIDGETLIVEHVPYDVKPMDFSVNLDNIDISRELGFLEKHYPGSKQRLQQMMFEGETKNVD